MFSLVPSVWKNPVSRFFICEFIDADGKRIQRSTKQLNKKDAYRIAVEWEDAAAAGRVGELTSQQAHQVLNRTLAIAGVGKLPRLTVEEAFSKWRTHHEKRWSPGTLIKYDKAVTSFLDYLVEGRKASQVRTITKQEIEAWHRDQIEQGKTDTTVEVYLCILRAAFGWMIDQDWLTDNPAKKVKLSGGSGSEFRQPFTDEEARAILKVCTRDWRGAALFSSWHSLRLGDVAGLTWGNLDPERGLLRYLPAKTRNKKKDPLTLVMAQDVIRWLSTLEQGVPSDPLFPTLFRRASGGHQGLSNEFARIMAKAGIDIPLGREKQGKGRRFRKKSFHSFRHLSITRMLEAEIAPEARKLMGAHSLNSTAHQTYLHMRPETQAAALAKMPSLTEPISDQSAKPDSEPVKKEKTTKPRRKN